MKKLLSTVIAATILTLPYGVSHAEESSKVGLNYEQALKKFDTIKNSIGNTKLDIKEKEKIRKENYELLNAVLDANKDMETQKVEKIISAVEDIDALMYDLEAEKGNTNFGSKSIDYEPGKEKTSNKMQEAAASWSGKGDILVSMKAKTYGLPHGHAAILSTTPHYVIEALPSPGVVHQSASKYWSTVDDEGQYYVKGASNSAYLNAVSYAKNQIGEPYKLKTSLNNTSEWYCSKLVYKAWLNAGYHVGTLDAYLGVVLPGSIKSDMDTVKYKSNPY
ncbi:MULTISPECIES: YiiX/YebB-like N1pC/P60 family cysteine hydrolase [Bacillus]|uniref:YiiX/YebB-like N1pC/P60 family cysteine hydrolase n=1 Tax=Bacillus TaxID=1386 RepID=UPI000BF1C664|nr:MULTISPECIES: YiiX/YebB-like N1pC/P60 family cysteine hydrolase [Bacillus]MCX2829682.1 YiiX/YebB-like N1pC/P60 family cysteine hydrolase [Bacillus sp. DHT2]MDR4918863.1 YiiX/YebB-like N1pC/P60 family cysteine hydrolase [Bacillus pseudomycoides]PEI38548.1 hypothetical protein CN641_27335 [Bacillus pseudomycoides]PEM28275.1 hypothetical protein CN634_29955 [Bacillus pseudomycoides]PEO40886.1 hypothetical protein CN559_28240 [Bacillus pseudomycoides]